MRETNARGNTVVYMPKDKTAAVNKLAELSALAASREWERAALVALLVRPTGGKRGRPSKMETSRHSAEQCSLADFLRIGIYGFRSKEAVSAYLKAWQIGGLDTPTFGQKAEMPSIEFPDYADLYGRPADSPAPAPEPIEEADADDDTEDEDEAQDAPPTPRPAPSPRPHPEVTVLDKFLDALDRTDPAAVVAGHNKDQVTLLIKTLDSWLDSLREAAEGLDDDE
jgi:hypothetical protein